MLSVLFSYHLIFHNYYEFLLEGYNFTCVILNNFSAVRHCSFLGFSGLYYWPSLLMEYLCFIIWICVRIFGLELKKICLWHYFFVASFRVFPDATVSSLREEIESQIGFEIIPREFVFLKCVGRCFTRVELWSLICVEVLLLALVSFSKHNIRMSNSQPNIFSLWVGKGLKPKYSTPFGKSSASVGLRAPAS